MRNTSAFEANLLLTKQAKQSSFNHGECYQLPDQIATRIQGGVLASPNTSPDPNTLASAPPFHRGEDHGQWSEALQSMLEQPPAALPRRLIWSSLIFTALVGVWAWFGTIQEVSVARGKVAPRGDVYKVQPTLSGEVISIYVKPGDRVEPGQKIAAIDPQLIEKEIQQLEETLSGHQIRLGQTQALMQQTQSELNILNAMAQADTTAKQSSLKQEKSAIITHQQMLDQLQVDRQAQVERMVRLEELVDQGAFAEDQLFQLEQALRDRDRTITETQGSMARSTAAIGQLEAELSQTQAMADKQQLTSQEKLKQLQIEATDLESKIRETKIILEASQAELSQTILRAPVSGRISSLGIANTGEVLEPGDTLAEITPGSAPLVLSTLLPSQEAGLVEEGMPVNIKFDAFPYQDYGLVTGEVVSISPDAQVDEKAGVVYKVDIALDQLHIQHETKAVALKAGQTATAEIIVRHRRIINLVLDPIRKLRKGNISL